MCLHKLEDPSWDEGRKAAGRWLPLTYPIFVPFTGSKLVVNQRYDHLLRGGNTMPQSCGHIPIPTTIFFIVLRPRRNIGLFVVVIVVSLFVFGILT